eukprot:scaffold23147_cov147-Isochrysis_galbana.AAC.2
MLRARNRHQTRDEASKWGSLCTLPVPRAYGRTESVRRWAAASIAGVALGEFSGGRCRCSVARQPCSARPCSREWDRPRHVPPAHLPRTQPASATDHDPHGPLARPADAG